MSILHHGFGVASALASSRKEEADGDPDEPPHRMSTKLDKITVSGMFDIMKPDEHPTVCWPLSTGAGLLSWLNAYGLS